MFHVIDAKCILFQSLFYQACQNKQNKINMKLAKTLFIKNYFIHSKKKKKNSMCMLTIVQS